MGGGEREWPGNDGEVMAAATSYPVVCLSSLLDEATTFKWSLRLAVEFDFRRMCFETDYLSLYLWWKRGLKGCAYLDAIYERLSNFYPTFVSFDFCFVMRLSNSVADFLTMNASTYSDHVWVKEVL